MKVISNLQAKIVALINIDELMPKGGLHLPDAIPLVVQRYGFVTAPSLSDPLQKASDDGFKFAVGKLMVSGQEHAIGDLTIYPDGVVVNAFTTSGAEAFLDDFLSWGSQALGFRATFATVTNRLYLSQLVVEFDYQLSSKLRVFWPFTNAFHEALRNTYSQDFPRAELVSMKFDYDRALAPYAFRALASLVIERRENHRHSEDSIFFSQAPLPNDQHVSLLETFEKSLASL